jgi:hypothetical protein
MTPIGLSYLTPQVVRSRPVFYRIAKFCAVAPLIAGVGVFLLWILTGAQPLPVIGLFLIPAGCILVLIGAIYLSAYLIIECKARGGFNRPLARQALIGAGLLLVNFPAAYACAGSAIYLMDFRLVRVINRSSTPIESFIVVDPLGSHELGPISPQQSVISDFESITRAAPSTMT